MGHMLFSYFYSMQPCSFLHKVSSRVSCSMGLAMAVARVLIRCRLISRSNSGKGSLDSSVPLFFSCSRPLSRSSERDARIELLTNRPSSASTPSLESFSMLLLWYILLGKHIPSILLVYLYCKREGFNSNSFIAGLFSIINV